MRRFIFARIAVTLLVNIGVCFGVTLRARHDERTHTKHVLEAATPTDRIPTRAETIDKMHDNDKVFSNDKNNEVRVLDHVDVLGKSAVHIIDANIEKAETIARLSSALKNKLKLGTQGSKGEIARMMEHVHWDSMKKEINEWLVEQRVSPATVFSYMRLESVFDQGMDLVALSHDPKLLLWFYYIIEYRRMVNVGSRYAPLDDEELLRLLVEHIKPRESSKLTFSLHDKSLYDPYLQVVKLFDSYRDEPSMESFAADMLAYLVSDSITKDFVLNLWLQKQVSPSIIFNVLRLGNERGRVGLDDMTLFTAWLHYAKMYLMSGALDFNIGSFIQLQLSTMSVPRTKALFESNALEHVLGGITHETGNLATYLRDIWDRYPLYLFHDLGLYGRKITSNNMSKFVRGISLVASYMKMRPFDGDIVFDALNPVHSFDEVVNLFQDLARQYELYDFLSSSQRSDVKQFADSMLLYLSDSSSILHLLELKAQPNDFWNFLFSNEPKLANIKHWFRFSVAYFRCVEQSRTEIAIIKTIFALRKHLWKLGVSRDTWLLVIETLGKEDARITSVWAFLTSNSQRAKKNPSQV